MTKKIQSHNMLPGGTKVLIGDAGPVGLVISRLAEGPASRYHVRFADGSEGIFEREQLQVFKHVHAEVPVSYRTDDFYRFVHYRCVVGSTAYGLRGEDSDIDRRGFYLPPADLHWSLAGIPEQLESDQEEVYWELEKFIRLALKANPNVLECLYSPLVETCTPLAEELLGIREGFLSRHVHRTYNSYVLSQFKKLDQDLRNRGQIRWKHVMHLIRLLLSGIVVLREGFVPLRVDDHRERLLSIRRGEVAWEEVESWRIRLHGELDRALESTLLPEHPDYGRANEFLLDARRMAASPDYGR